MLTETIPAQAEAISSEQIYESFLDGLRMVVELEKKTAAMFLEIERDQMDNIGGTFSLEQLQEYTASLRDLYYGSDSENKSLHNDLITGALRIKVQDNIEKYSAFKHPQLVREAIKLARLGILSEFTQQRVIKARAEKHYQSNGSRRHSGTRTAINGLSKATQVHDLVVFNHVVRDLINNGAGRAMGLDREKTKKIMRVAMLGNAEQADELETGIALEVATKRLAERMMQAKYGDSSAVEFGDEEQDRKGGDMILFGYVFVDIKKTPPPDVRRQLAENEINEPGIFWKDQRNVYLWLGTDHSVGNNYGLPRDYADTLGHLIAESQPQAAVA